MNYRLVVLASALCATSAPVLADVLGVSAGVTAWNADYSGDVRSGGQSVDVSNDLGLGSDTYLSGYVAVEHPVPVLPNAKLQFTELSQSADGRVTLITPFKDITLSGDVHTDIDLTHTDLILYYEVLDNIVSIDVGLDIKVFDGELTLIDRTTGQTSQTDIDQIVPMLYVAPQVNLPLTGLSVGGSLAGVGYSGNRLVDANIGVRYEIAVVGIEAGWRQLNLKLDDVDDVDADVKLGGPYLSLQVDF